MNTTMSGAPKPHAMVEQTEAVFRIFFDNHPCGMLIADRDGTSVHVNRTLTQMLGYGSSTRFPASAGKRLVASPSGVGDRELWGTLLRDGLVAKHRIEVVTHNGTARRFFVTGCLLQRRRDGNHVAGWMVLDERDGEPEPSGRCSTRAKPDSVPDRCAVPLVPGMDGQNVLGEDCSSEVSAMRDTDEANALILNVLTQQKRDLEARLALNFEVTVLPILDHLKALDMATCQRILLETLDFNLRHIMSAFGIHVARNSKYLSSREREICQMIRAGKNSHEIAAVLGLKHQTVLVHRKHIRKKLDLKPGGVRLSMALRALPAGDE